ESTMPPNSCACATPRPKTTPSAPPSRSQAIAASGSSKQSKTDVLGRVYMPKERREAILDAYECSAMSGQAFAAHVGVKSPTLATWLQRWRKRDEEKKGACCYLFNFDIIHIVCILFNHATKSSNREREWGLPHHQSRELPPGYVYQRRGASVLR
ncbi:MAG: hypothetical protein ACI9JZ_003027, partial [Lentimonas sp.]